MWKLLAIIVIVVSQTGCAGMITAMSEDPVRIEKISASKDDALATISLSAEKRNVLVQLDGKKARFCAEPPPEIAKAFNIDRGNLLTGEVQLSEEHKAQLKTESKETIKEAITVLAQRTVLLDVYRTGTYTLCQFYLNGAINEPDLLVQFSNLTQGVLKALTIQPVVDMKAK